MYNEGSFAEGFIAGTNSHQGYYNNGMFGGDGAWWIIILLIFGWGEWIRFRRKWRLYERCFN